jgi:hypothetical protein
MRTKIMISIKQKNNTNKNSSQIEEAINKELTSTNPKENIKVIKEIKK